MAFPREPVVVGLANFSTQAVHTQSPKQPGNSSRHPAPLPLVHSFLVAEYAMQIVVPKALDETLTT
jgi:hypothetical protein